MAFWFKPLNSPQMLRLQEILTLFFVIDIFITPFTGIKREENFQTYEPNDSEDEEDNDNSSKVPRVEFRKRRST